MEVVLARLAECIALPSPTPPGDVHLVANWVETWAREFGAEVSRQEVEPGKDNVLARLHFGPGATLVFNTHMDVNDPSTQEWATPPFTATTRGGRVYGRGTCDAKGSLVAMLCAMENIAADPEGITGEILLTAVMGEEAGGIGSRHLVDVGLSADGAVVGEPTGLQVASAHKGTYIRRVRFRGKAAHSARPWLGRNAVTHAAAFCMACTRVTNELARLPHPLLGPATLTVTGIAGGAQQNTVPEEAVVTVDRRLLPGQTHDDCDQEMTALLAELAQDQPELQLDSVETVVATVPSETPAGAAVVSSALKAVGRAGRPQDTVVGFPAGCDMSKLVNIAGIPTVVCGPGSLSQAHAPDEFVAIDEVLDAVRVYELTARDFLERRG
jgi:acetylornithine deacetylase/succinyl-diaminopimelate desuccinylase family protein